jgi:hypothetical protein
VLETMLRPVMLAQSSPRRDGPAPPKALAENLAPWAAYALGSALPSAASSKVSVAAAGFPAPR